MGFPKSITQVWILRHGPNYTRSGQEYETAICPRPSFSMAIGREHAHPGEIAAPGRGRKHEIQKSERCAGCTVPAQLRVSSRYTDAKRGKVLGSKTCH